MIFFCNFRVLVQSVLTCFNFKHEGHGVCPPGGGDAGGLGGAGGEADQA